MVPESWPPRQSLSIQTPALPGLCLRIEDCRLTGWGESPAKTGNKYSIFVIRSPLLHWSKAPHFSSIWQIYWAELAPNHSLCQRRQRRVRSALKIIFQTRWLSRFLQRRKLEFPYEQPNCVSFYEKMGRMCHLLQASETQKETEWRRPCSQSSCGFLSKVTFRWLGNWRLLSSSEVSVPVTWEVYKSWLKKTLNVEMAVLTQLKSLSSNCWVILPERLNCLGVGASRNSYA